jgi:glycerol uptake facilitator-like aquaporin
VTSTALGRRVLAEYLGTCLLTAAVVGSGIAAERLADGNGALALLANTLATVAALAVLIALLMPVSGAHFNPLVSAALVITGRLRWSEATGESLAQLLGACSGTVLAHAMFALPLLQHSQQVRSGPAQWLSEGVATGGLILIVSGLRREADAPWMVSAWIAAAYWFTASTAFANPAIALARSLTDSYSGIRPADVPMFVVAEIAGAIIAVVLGRALFRDRSCVRC